MSTSILKVTNGATPATPASGKTNIFVNASKVLSQVDDTGAVKTLAGGNASFSGTPSDPTGTNNTTGLMMGLGATCTITPTLTGRIKFTISGNLSSSGTSIGNGGKVQLYYNSGSAPANGAALTGNAIGSQITSVNESTTANTKQFVMVHFIVSALVLGTAYWFDAAVAALVGGTASLTNITATAEEF